MACPTPIGGPARSPQQLTGVFLQVFTGGRWPKRSSAEHSAAHSRAEANILTFLDGDMSSEWWTLMAARASKEVMLAW
ncbi:hypothetical protein IMZ48_17150 [Candidatus Bathyarchaeota archaeon]|nr:hypothetical protein [Candidatus Bathyarchaeota archaeon]